MITSKRCLRQLQVGSNYLFVFNNKLIIQWCLYYTGNQGALLPTSFNHVFKWAVAYRYYNNNIFDCQVTNTYITHAGGPEISVICNVIAIGI